MLLALSGPIGLVIGAMQSEIFREVLKAAIIVVVRKSL